MYTYEDVFTSSNDYASRFSGEVGAWLLNVQTRTISEILAQAGAKPAAILDVGGGHGQLTAVAEECGAAELAVLVSHQDALTNMEQRTSSSAQKVKVSGIVSDLLNLSVADNSYPLVSAVRLVSHCDDWKKLIQELCRVSSDLVLIDYPPLVSNNILNSLLFPLKKRLEGNTRTFTVFCHSELRQAFQQQGFELVERKGQFFLPMVIHRKLALPKVSRIVESIFKLLGLSGFLGNPTIALFKRKA